jgi:hypothetical protein
MGEPDLEYLRVEQGTFANPDERLLSEDENPQPSIIDFKDIIAAERFTVDLARLRQTLALCTFANEIFEFLKSRSSPDAQPYAEDYSHYWKAKIDVYASRCEQAKISADAKKFTSGDELDRVDYTETDKPRLGNILRLPRYLRDLAYGEQTTSAETLLTRVLRNLALGEQILTDSPRLTRRGYRLPVKANPLDCGTISSNGKPLEKPIVGPEGTCAYRLSTNVAMEAFENLTGAAEAKNLRAMLGGFAQSQEPAFDILVTATVNGQPVPFSELMGAETGNDGCELKPDTPKSCIGTYGSFEAGSYFRLRHSRSMKMLSMQRPPAFAGAGSCHPC